MNSPWALTENEKSRTEYGKGNCPHADRLFESSSILAVPSCLTKEDENDIITAFDKVLSAVAA
jgi:dTDP-4-amino-4,6-dideoxygalactose transaminase